MLMWFAVGRMVQFAVPKTQFKGSKSRTVFYQPKSPVKIGISVVPSLTLNSTENECVCVRTKVDSMFTKITTFLIKNKINWNLMIS